MDIEVHILNKKSNLKELYKRFQFFKKLTIDSLSQMIIKNRFIIS
jgi:hypothetical protein